MSVIRDSSPPEKITPTMAPTAPGEPLGKEIVNGPWDNSLFQLKIKADFISFPPKCTQYIFFIDSNLILPIHPNRNVKCEHCLRNDRKLPQKLCSKMEQLKNGSQEGILDSVLACNSHTYFQSSKARVTSNTA